MSVFPKRLAPGQTVTVHVRHLLLPEHAPGLRAFDLEIFDPEKVRVFRERRDAFLFPSVLLDPNESDSRARFNFSPLLMTWQRPADVPASSATEQEVIAGLAKRQRGRSGPEEAARLNALLEAMVQERYQPGHLTQLVHTLAVMNASSHFYVQWEVPADARGGKYGIRITAHGDMALSGASPTVLMDELHVDRLRLGAVVVEGDGVRAEINNESAELVPVRVAERSGEGMLTRRVDLPPGTTTMTFRMQPALILYAEGTRALMISSSRAPLLSRNARLVFQANPDGEVGISLPPRSILGLDEGEAIDVPRVCRALDLAESAPLVEELVTRGSIVLSGPIARALEFADGLHQTCEVTRACGAEALSMLRSAGFVRTIELASIA